VDEARAATVSVAAAVAAALAAVKTQHGPCYVQISLSKCRGVHSIVTMNRDDSLKKLGGRISHVNF